MSIILDDPRCRTSPPDQLTASLTICTDAGDMGVRIVYSTEDTDMYIDGVQRIDGGTYAIDDKPQRFGSTFSVTGEPGMHRLTMFVEDVDGQEAPKKRSCRVTLPLW